MNTKSNIPMNPTQIESMTYGLFNNKSYFGFRSNVLKSGICKYYRREMFDKFEWCVMEMSMFILGEEKGKSLWTNLLNRLRILLMEEIACDVECIYYGIEILNRLGETDITQKVNHIKAWADLVLFCNIVKQAKRGRIISYVNNWWRNSKLSYEMQSPYKEEMGKRFKCKGDHDDMVRIASELYDGFMYKRESVFILFTKLMNRKGSYGSRWRRKDAVYLYWKVLEDIYILQCENVEERTKRRKIFDFALVMFFRKQMTERPAFAVWVGFLCIHRDNDQINSFTKNIKSIVEKETCDNVYACSSTSIMNYIQNRKSIKIHEDFVVKDWHVNKQYGLNVFADSGSVVTNEDLTLLGENADKYREFYKQVKRYNPRPIKKQKFDSKPKSPTKSLTILPANRINFHERFKVLKAFDAGVCGLKRCCIQVEDKKDGEVKVLKEMSVNGLNTGVDYCILDELKEVFGLEKIGMERFVCNTTIQRKDKEVKTYRGNWELSETTNDAYFVMMRNIDDVGALSEYKYIFSNEEIKMEMLKIRLFRGIFRSSDNIIRNILVYEDKVKRDSYHLVGIDEGDICGKRKTIFNSTESKKAWYNIEVMKSVWREWMNTKEDKIQKIREVFNKYQYDMEKGKEAIERFEQFDKCIETNQ